MPQFDVRRLAVATVAAAAMFLAACERHDTPIAAEHDSAVATGTIRPIQLPDLTSAAQTVRQQITQLHDDVAAASGASAADRAQRQGDLGIVLLAASYVDAAEVAFTNAEILDPADARWPYYLGHVHRQQQEPDRAIAAFTKARRLNPVDVPTLVWLGETHLALGRPDDAVEPLRAALDHAPGHARATAALGRAALDRRNYAAAVTHLEEAARLAPAATSLRYPLSLAYRGLGNTRTADEQLRLRGDVDVRFADPLMETVAASLNSAAVYDRRSRAALARGDWATALSGARGGLEVVGDNATLRSTLHQRLGTALAQHGDTAAARREFERAVIAAPDFAVGHYSLGLMLAGEGRRDAALDAFSAAIRHQPGYLPALIARGDTLRREGRSADALADYRRALESDPNQLAARFGEAVSLIGLERHVEARDVLSRTLAAHPGDRPLTFVLVRLLAGSSDARVRDPDRARALAEPLAQSGPTIEAAETLAFTLAAQGRFDNAVTLQRGAAAEARRTGQPARARFLDAVREAYERRTQPARLWREEPVYDPTS